MAAFPSGIYIVLNLHPGSDKWNQRAGMIAFSRDIRKLPVDLLVVLRFLAQKDQSLFNVLKNRECRGPSLCWNQSPTKSTDASKGENMKYLINSKSVGEKLVDADFFKIENDFVWFFKGESHVVSIHRAEFINTIDYLE